MSIEMNYLIDSLAECIMNEKESKDSTTSIARIIKIACTSINDKLHEFDVSSRIKIMNDLAAIIGGNRFASMLVYSRFKSFPGLNELSNLTRRKMVSIAASDSLRAFCEWFVDKNIDNDMSDSVKTFTNYVRDVVYDKLDDVGYNLPMQTYCNVLTTLRRSYGGFDNMVMDLREFVESDMIEYIDLSYLVGQFDDAVGDRQEDLIRDTDDILSGSVYMTVDSLIKYIQTGNTDVLLVDHLQKCGRAYTTIVNNYTGCLSSDEIDDFVNRLTKTCIDVSIKSMFRRVIERMLVIMNDIPNIEEQIRYAANICVIVSDI